jgi:hypothetical protein
VKTHTLPLPAAEKLARAIRDRRCVAFTYHGRRRFVEPQTLGVSDARRIVLRCYERDGQAGALKLFDVAQMERLRRTRVGFPQARPGHNPHDSAMSPVIASLPLPE